MTPIFHDFWNYTDPQQQQMQMGNFLKNASLAGAMLLIIANGPGLFSADVLFQRSDKR